MPVDDRVLELTRLWWAKSAEDLQVAKASRRFPFASCFHCQQAVEKGIKALLVFYQADFEKTHDIGLLLARLNEAGVAVPAPFIEALPGLSRFAVETRYPPGDATQEEARESFQEAEQFLLWVRKQLPKEV